MNNAKENIENLLNLLRQWQDIEDDAIRNTTEIIKKTSNPIIHLIMEIIRQDSVTHRKVQQLIINHYEKFPLCIESYELSELWDAISEHDEVERKTIELAAEALKRNDSPLVNLLLDYLITDEKKHDKLLTSLEKFKDDAYPASRELDYI